ncbi:Ger(x)C family spore germination protein [Salipaludibacillus sp. CUR1]|uniref:Ger(x)C family spore germination protein n=1 Tax=Salipaludibacillus sp. CUR1 TaxID=2820003 RepID=UPI001E55AF78|nr:Ger(x)C family spore germination protein [Salipaludibacillus sp. CUR1]MCE7794052.1 Ger(x)C family spore germination protein [Salipaludibacillus sp. CUR1]
MRKKFLLSLFGLAALLLLPGCWDSQEIEEAAWVTSLGFDLAEEDGPFEVHQMVALTKMLAAGDQGGQGEEDAFFMVSETADSIQTAVFKAKEFLAREPKYGHVSNIIASEELLREKGVSSILSYTLRDHVLRPFIWISVASPNAKSVMEKRTGLEDIPSQAYLGIMDQAEDAGLAFAVNLLEASKRYLNENQDLVLPIITHKEGQVHIDGMALFKEDLMVDSLHSLDARGLSWALDRGEGLVSISSKDEQLITVSFRESNSEVSVEKADDASLEMNVDINLQGDISDIEKEHTVAFLSEEDIPEVTKDVEEEVISIVENSIAKVQKAQSDVFGAADMIAEEFPDVWKKIEGDWREQYEEMPVNVNVKVDLNRSKRIK